MSIPMSSIRFQAGLALILAILTPLALQAGAAARAPDAHKQWRVEYVSGPIELTLGKKKKQVVPLWKGARLGVEVSPEGIVCKAKKKVLLSIPVTKVTEITYDHASHRVSKAVVSGLGNMGGGCAGVAYGCGSIVMADLFVAVATLPFKYTNHFVGISWQGDEQENEIELEVGKHDYASFLSELQSATNLQWKNLGQEKASALQALHSAGACQDPALAGDDLSLPLGKPSQMQEHLNAAGACGFRLENIEASTAVGLTAKMRKVGEAPASYQYLVVHALRASKMQAALNQAGANGYRLRPGMPTLGTYPPILVLEKTPEPVEQTYQYLYCTGWRESAARKKADQAHVQGYEMVDRTGAGGQMALVLEKSTDTRKEKQ